MITLVGEEKYNSVCRLLKFLPRVLSINVYCCVTGEVRLMSTVVLQVKLD